MSTWTTNAWARGRPDDVLRVLTDPAAAARWAPVTFELEGSERLVEGRTTVVRGQVAGWRVEFELDVHRAREDVLELTAEGPVVFDVRYRVEEQLDGSQIEASVSVVRRPGLVNALVARCAETLFAGGALKLAVTAIAAEVDALQLQ